MVSFIFLKVNVIWCYARPIFKFTSTGQLSLGKRRGEVGENALSGVIVIYTKRCLILNNMGLYEALLIFFKNCILLSIITDIVCASKRRISCSKRVSMNTPSPLDNLCSVLLTQNLAFFKICQSVKGTPTHL